MGQRPSLSKDDEDEEEVTIDDDTLYGKNNLSLKKWTDFKKTFFDIMSDKMPILTDYKSDNNESYPQYHIQFILKCTDQLLEMVYKERKGFINEDILNIVGCACLFISIKLFYGYDYIPYNDGLFSVLEDFIKKPNYTYQYSKKYPSLPNHTLQYNKEFIQYEKDIKIFKKKSREMKKKISQIELNIMKKTDWKGCEAFYINKEMRLINFYLNLEPCPTGYMFNDIIKVWDDKKLEITHDYIQYLFPLQEKSKYNKDDILLTENDIEFFKNNKGIVLLALNRMLQFYGIPNFKFDGKQRYWMKPDDHNHLRLTRIMRFLQLIGMGIASVKLFIVLCKINREIKNSISEKTFTIWKNLFMSGSVFTKENVIGDFKWMIKQHEYDDTLFIFNDNVESITSYRKGNGNAVIRVYNQYNPKLSIPRSAGIPTGYSTTREGFKNLTTEVKKYIDDSIEKIENIIIKYNYKKIIYSINKNAEFGTEIFKVGDDVKRYIIEQLYRLKLKYMLF